MAKKQTRSRAEQTRSRAEQTRSRAEETRSGADRLTHPLLEKLGAIPAAQAELFAYSVKIVCGKQTETNCCCVAGARPGVYATEVNIQNLNLVPAPVVKLVIPLINSGAVVAREPNVADPFALPGRAIAEAVRLPPLGATMDDCCRIAELLLGAPPSGDTGAHHRHPDDREPGRAVRLGGLHGKPSERGRHQHRRRVHSVATTGTSWPGLVGFKNAKQDKDPAGRCLDRAALGSKPRPKFRRLRFARAALHRPPVLFGLALHRRAGRVLHLEPVG